MPVVDLSPQELMSYSGMNPKPRDFDAYWDRALSDMRALDAQVDMQPAAFQAPFADCLDLTFTGVGGARVYAKYLRPKDFTAPHPAVLVFHGYTGDSGDWVRLLPYAAAGFSVAALDCRGQGGRSQDVGGVVGNTMRGQIIRGLDNPDADHLLFRSIFLDCAQLAGIVMDQPEVDEKRVGATGGSQGGGLTLACSALEPRIARLAPVYPFLTDYKRVWHMDLGTEAYLELKEYFRHFDPRHEREEEVFTKLGYIDVQHLAGRIRGQVWMFTGLMDETCPPSTQFAAYNKIQAPKQATFYPDFGHEGLPDVDDLIFQYMMGL